MGPDSLEQRLGHAFADQTLLVRALTHPSYIQDHPNAGENNQRLEFLGDAVLQLIITEALFARFPGEREGVLSRRRAILTKGSCLAGLAREIGLQDALRLSAGEESAGGRHKASALEDAFEALVGALFLDGGSAKAREVVLRIYGSLDARLASAGGEDNPKGRLQERIQPVHGNDALAYEVIEVHGADHARGYVVEARLNGQPIGRGQGRSKKLAEEEAARAALASVNAPGAAEPGHAAGTA